MYINNFSVSIPELARRLFFPHSPYTDGKSRPERIKLLHNYQIQIAIH